MRSFVVLAVSAIVAMLVQTTIFPFVLSRLPIVPDLILVLAVYLGIRHRGVGGAMGAFLLGYFLDTFSGTLTGMNAFALTAVYAAATLIARHLWMEGGFPVVAVVFVGGCVRSLATVALSALVAARTPVWHHVLRYGFLEAAAAALIAPLVFASLRWEKRLLGAA
jgi:rod shape-determining protein MreD